MVATGLAVLGKGLNGMVFAGLYVLTAELAPTTLRSGAMGLASMCARISGMAAPYVGGPLVGPLYSVFNNNRNLALIQHHWSFDICLNKDCNLVKHQSQLKAWPPMARLLAD